MREEIKKENKNSPKLKFKAIIPILVTSVLAFITTVFSLKSFYLDNFVLVLGEQVQRALHGLVDHLLGLLVHQLGRCLGKSKQRNYMHNNPLPVPPRKKYNQL